MSRTAVCRIACRAPAESLRRRSINAPHECPLFPVRASLSSRRHGKRGGCRPRGRSLRRCPARCGHAEFRWSNRTGRTKNARIVRCQSSRMSMTRNSARISPRREAGVGLPPDAVAGGEEWFIPGQVSPRRSQAGRLPKKEPRRCAGRTAGQSWPVSPAGHESVRILSSLIIQIAESRFNGWPSTTPFLALGVGPEGPPRETSPSRP